MIEKPNGYATEDIVFWGGAPHIEDRALECKISIERGGRGICFLKRLKLKSTALAIWPALIALISFIVE